MGGNRCWFWDTKHTVHRLGSLAISSANQSSNFTPRNVTVAQVEILVARSLFVRYLTTQEKVKSRIPIVSQKHSTHPISTHVPLHPKAFSSEEMSCRFQYDPSHTGWVKEKKRVEENAQVSKNQGHRSRVFLFRFVSKKGKILC